MFRRTAAGAIEVFLVHPGGPFWAHKDEGAWGIPKGEYHQGEEPLSTAQREFTEETGFVAEGPFLALGTITQSGGKEVTAWAFEGDADPSRLVSNTCEIEWPRKSGRRLTIPENDRGAWYSPDEARRAIKPAQVPLIDALLAQLA